MNTRKHRTAPVDCPCGPSGQAQRQRSTGGPHGWRVLLSIAAFFLSLSGPGRAVNEIASISCTPPDIDFELVSRVWRFIKNSTQAPQDLAPPRLVLDWSVPPFARMAFQFPTQQFPDLNLQISIAPRAFEQTSREMVSWAIGHELAHYAFVLRENSWNPRLTVYVTELKHHCDPEFKQLTRAIADEIWSAYHSETQRAAMYREVERSCIRHPEQ